MLGQWPFFPPSSVTIWVLLYPPTTASFFIAMHLRKEIKTQNTEDKGKMLGHLFHRQSQSKSHFIIQQLHPSIILYCDASGWKGKIPKTKTAWSVAIFKKRHPLHLSFAVWPLIVNVHEEKNKNTGQKNTQKSAFQTWINKNHLMPYEPRWPPLCGPTTAYLHHSLWWCSRNFCSFYKITHNSKIHKTLKTKQKQHRHKKKVIFDCIFAWKALRTHWLKWCKI